MLDYQALGEVKTRKPLYFLAGSILFSSAGYITSKLGSDLAIGREFHDLLPAQFFWSLSLMAAIASLLSSMLAVKNGGYRFLWFVPPCIFINFIYVYPIVQVFLLIHHR